MVWRKARLRLGGPWHPHTDWLRVLVRMRRAPGYWGMWEVPLTKGTQHSTARSFPLSWTHGVK